MIALRRPAHSPNALEQVLSGTKVRDVRRVRREVSPALAITLAVLVFALSAAVTWFVIR